MENGTQALGSGCVSAVKLYFSGSFQALPPDPSVPGRHVAPCKVEKEKGTITTAFFLLWLLLLPYPDSILDPNSPNRSKGTLIFCLFTTVIRHRPPHAVMEEVCDLKALIFKKLT